METWGDLVLDDSFDFDDPGLLYRSDIKVILAEKLWEIKRRNARIRGRGSQSPESTSIENYDDQVDDGVGPVDVIEEEEEVQYPSKDEVTASLLLISRPWFTRCWVLQEVSLAREALVLCDTSSINWESFFIGFMLIMVLGDGGLTGPPEKLSRSNITLTTTVRNKLHHAKGSVQAQHIDLLWLLRKVRGLDVTDRGTRYIRFLVSLIRTKSKWKD